tara:strand:- start:2349 stop:2576 length:228 start_codon:yes stop_codon:yes gene_type:complete
MTISFPINQLNISRCESVEVETHWQPTCSVTVLTIVSATYDDDTKVRTTINLFTNDKDKHLITSVNGKRITEKEI